MIIIEDSYIQLISLYFATINKRNYNFFVVFGDKEPKRFINY